MEHDPILAAFAPDPLSETDGAAAFNRAMDANRPAVARILQEMGPEGTFARAPAPAPRNLRLLTLAECSGAPLRGYIVKGLIAPGDLAVMFGPPGSGKSVVAPYLAHAIACGARAFGRRTRRGPVLYVAAEDGAGMQQRAAALRAVYGDADNLRILVEPIDLQGDGATEPGDLAAILAAADRIGAVLIVIDTMARAFPGLDENDGRSMSRAVHILRALCSRTRAVLVVHHGAKAGSSNGTGGATPRGHSVLNGDADVTLRVEAPEDGPGARTIHLGKNRNGVALADMAFTIRGEPLGVDEDGDEVTAPVAEEIEHGGGSAADAARRKAEARLRDDAALLLRELRDLAADAPPSRPQHDMPMVAAVERSQLRARLLRAGWFTEDEVRAGVPSDGNGPLPITRPAQRREAKALDALKRKGFAGFTSAQAWPT